MEFWQLTTSIGRQWQQTFYLVIALITTLIKIQWAHCRSQSHWLESSPTRITGHGRRLSRSSHPFLEHPHAAASTCSGYRFPSVQLDVQSQLLRNCVDSWLQLKPSYLVEIPNDEKNTNLERSQLQSTVLRYVTLWREYRDGSWRRNAKILEHVPIEQ